MARRYISKHLLENQQQFIHLLDEYEIDIFSFDEIENHKMFNFSNLHEIIENLVDKKFIARIEKGKYCRANFKDEKVIGCFLVPDGVISYWTALNLHGLTEQFSNNIFIQTNRVKKNKTVFGINYQFVKIKNAKRVGVTKEGYGNYTYRITDKEKTLVDCFDLPQYSGGYSELIRAFSQAELNQDKMIEYCKSIGNISVVKRLAFLAELLHKPKMTKFIRFAKQEINSRYVLMDPFGEEQGSFNAKWKLRLNITTDEILNICNKQY